jgi:hypothetical protein
MRDTAVNLRPACSDLLPEPGTQRFQLLGPDPIPSRACARAERPEGRDPGREGPLRERAFREPEGPAARHPQPAPPPARAAVAPSAARHARPARQAQTLSAAAGAEPRLAAGSPAGSWRADRHRFRPDAFGGRNRRGDREGAHRHQPRRDYAKRRAAPRAAGAQTAACVASQAVARHRPLRGVAPRRKRAGKFAVRKFPVQSRKIPCSKGISADAAPALDGCATLCR